MKNLFYKSHHSPRQTSQAAGNVFIGTVLVIVVVSLLAFTWYRLSINDLLRAERHRQIITAFHAAEAGIERALSDMQADFAGGPPNNSWLDGTINGISVTAVENTDVLIPYDTAAPTNNALPNGAVYNVYINVTPGANGRAAWLRADGTFEDVTQTILVYTRIDRVSIWDNAIFAGTGSDGTAINGNVDVRGSVHVLGDNLNSNDLAIDLSGTALMAGNNYEGLDATLRAKIPAPKTVTFNGESIASLESELRVKKGQVGLSGGSTVGQQDITGNTVKETLDGVFVTDGYGGNQSPPLVYSDNGTNNTYDLGNLLTFPGLDSAYTAADGTVYSDYYDYVVNSGEYAVVNVNSQALGTIRPTSNFEFTGTNGAYLKMQNGLLEANGIIMVENGGLRFDKAGNEKTITYQTPGAAGGATFLLDGSDINVNVNLITPGANSFPVNKLGFMTNRDIVMNSSQIDVMGLFYAENEIQVQKQTDIIGTIVSNYFDMGSNVPAIFQVPDTAENLPPAMIGKDPFWIIKTVVWKKGP